MEIIKSNTKQKIMDSFTWFIWMCFMTFSLTYMIVFALALKFSPLKLMAVTMIVLSIWCVILMNKLTLVITCISLAVCAAGESLFLYKKHRISSAWESLLEQAIHFAKWVIRCVSGYPVEGDSYSSYFVIILCIVIACIIYIFTIKRFQFSLLFMGGASLFGFEVTQRRAISPIALYLFIFTSLIYFFKSRYFSLKKELDEMSNGTYKAFMKTSIYIGTVILICGAVLANFYPYQSKWLHDLTDFLVRKQYYYIADNFSVESAGFQENDGLLGGDITLKDITVLKVETPYPTYLKAISYDVYTGNAWENTQEEPVVIDLNDERLEDTTETIEGVKWLSNNEDSIETLFDKNTAHVRYINMSTKSLFIPSKMESFDITSFKRDVYLIQSDALSLKKAANKNFTYTAEFYEPHYTSDRFKKVIRKSKVGFYNEIKEEYPDDMEAITKWSDHAAIITGHYTQLPEALPIRIKELARSITQGKNNNYDRVKAIEEYLTEYYFYTLRPGNPKEERDFVDQFLFENKKGYCTYFASALAILTRSIGIPSRYVEGYVLPKTPEAGQTAYWVTNKRAHAWVEVYFEGMGWIIFEATPPYRHSETIEGSEFSMEEAMRNGQGSYTGEIPTITLDGRGQFHIYKVIIGGTILGLLGGVILLYKMRKRRLEKMNCRAAILYLYNVYLKLLSHQDLSIRLGETEKVFARRVDRLISFQETTFGEITELFLVARYSQLELTKEDKEKMLSFRYELLKASKKRVGLMEYFTCLIRYRFL
ncbi:MAG: transglutaminase protein [Clostridia bacterium]|jgi:hypothetical protein|nr:transglutaminase protein [Clostridia bacterium]